MKKTVAVIDYEMGNLFSVGRACEYVGLSPVITSDGEDIQKADAAILPGVGAFGDAMDNLRRLGLDSAAREFINSGRPFMGICLGLQLLFSESEEFGSHEGLDIIRGSVVKFPVSAVEGRKVKVPQVGWNRIMQAAPKGRKPWDATPLKDVRDGEFMYFVHSYYVVPEKEEAILTTTDYEGTVFCSSILWKNIFACQFHPEKSADAGLTIYRNWAATILDDK